MIIDLSRTLPGCPADKSEDTFWHVEGASRRERFSALGLRVRSTGTRAWVWDFNSGGKKRRLTLGSPDEGMSFADAQRAVLIARVKLGAGEQPGEKEPAGERLATFLDAYLVEVDNGILRGHEVRRPEYVRKVKQRVEILRQRWGSRTASSISRADISRLLDEFNDRPPTQRVLQATISAFFGFAEDRYGLPHPGRGMKLRGGSKQGTRFLTDAELRVVLPTLRSCPQGSILRFALLTGRRLKEVTRMKWSELDLDKKLHHLPAARSKNHKDHTVPLSAGAMECLPDVLAGQNRQSYVFKSRYGGPIGEPRIGLAAVNALLEAPVKYHDLRRTAASHLGQIGCPLELITAILNQTPPGPAVTSLYVRSDPLPKMREWLDRLSEHYHALERESA